MVICPKIGCWKGQLIGGETIKDLREGDIICSLCGTDITKEAKKKYNNFLKFLNIMHKFREINKENDDRLYQLYTLYLEEITGKR